MLECVATFTAAPAVHAAQGFTQITTVNAEHAEHAESDKSRLSRRHEEPADSNDLLCRPALPTVRVFVDFVASWLSVVGTSPNAFSRKQVGHSSIVVSLGSFRPHVPETAALHRNEKRYSRAANVRLKADATGIQ